MTEYDYSPEAYERYMRTQQRIAQWVDNTEAHRREFGTDAHHLVDTTTLTQRPSHRPMHSMHEVPRYHRKRSSSMTSSESEEHSSNLPQPLPQLLPGLNLGYPQPSPNDPAFPDIRRRPSSAHHHHRSHRSPIQTYVVSPTQTSPAQQHPPAYNVAAGNLFTAPATFGYPSKKPTTYTSPTTTPFNPPPTYYTQSGYPFPSYQVQPSSAPPGGSFNIYAPQPTTYTQVPYSHAAYPPTIYPLTSTATSPVYTAYPQTAQAPPISAKPHFYQRFFRHSSSKKRNH